LASGAAPVVRAAVELLLSHNAAAGNNAGGIKLNWKGNP
jgi:hypothetical protein